MAYREVDRPRTPARVVDFDRLPAPVRERFARATHHLGAPTPLAAERPNAPGTIARWLLLALLGAGFGTLLALFGYGDADATLALHSGAFTVLYFAAATSVFVGVVFAFRLARLRGRLPYLPGRYLFAIDLVETDGKRLYVTSLAGLREAQAREIVRRGRYIETEIGLSFDNGAIEEISVVGRDAAAALMEQLRTAREAAEVAVLPENVSRLERIDPFFEVRMGEDWEGVAPKGASLRQRPPRPRRGIAHVLVPTLLAAAVVAPIARSIRNTRSDDAMFSAMLEKHTAAAMRAYLKRGVLHHNEADDALFDAAHGKMMAVSAYLAFGGSHTIAADDELFAIAQGLRPPSSSRDAYERALDTYLQEGTRHASEVKTELLPRSSLDAIESAVSISGLRLFLQENPEAAPALRKEAADAIHARYAQALVSFAHQGEKLAPRSLPFVTKLIEYLETHESTALRAKVTSKQNTSIEEKDAKEIAREAAYVATPDLAEKIGARFEPASPSFDKFHTNRIERTITEEVRRAMGEMFPEDVLTIATSDDPHAASPSPVIHIEYEPIATGATYISNLSQLRFLEVRFGFDVTLSIPGSDERFHFSMTSKPPAAGFEAETSLDGSSDVYLQMIRLAAAGLVLGLEDAMLRSNP